MGISCHVFLFNGYFPIWNAYVFNALGAPLLFMYTSLFTTFRQWNPLHAYYVFFNTPIDYIFFRWIAFLRIDRCHLQLIHFTLSVSIDSINELKAISDMMKLIVDGNDGGDRVCCSCSYNDYYWIHDANSANFFFISIVVWNREASNSIYFCECLRGKRVVDLEFLFLNNINTCLHRSSLLSVYLLRAFPLSLPLSLCVARFATKLYLQCDAYYSLFSN